MKRFDIFFAESCEIYSTARHRSDPDILVNGKRVGDYVLAVKLRADYSGAYRVAVKSHQQVEQRRDVQSKSRIESPAFRVALAGYTNAG